MSDKSEEPPADTAKPTKSKESTDTEASKDTDTKPKPATTKTIPADTTPATKSTKPEEPADTKPATSKTIPADTKPATTKDTTTDTKPATSKTTTDTKPATSKTTTDTTPATSKTTTDTKPATSKTSADTKQSPAKPESAQVELPAFEKGISEKITKEFGDKVEVGFVKKDRVRINTGRDNIHDVAVFIRDELNYDHVESVSGVDYPQDNEIEVVYHLGSYSDSSLERQILVLTTRAQRETNPIPGKDATRLPTLRDVFYSVEFHEREIFEMFGVFFEGHPDNRRLLLPEDWADLPPLRKDFAIKGR